MFVRRLFGQNVLPSVSPTLGVAASTRYAARFGNTVVMGRKYFNSGLPWGQSAEALRPVEFWLSAGSG